MPRTPLRAKLDEDPDDRLRRWGWLAWLVFTALLAALWWRTGALDGAAALPWALGAPALGLWLLWPLWRGGAAGWHWMRARPHADWHGAYFEFNGRQIRVVFADDDIWIAANDVFDAFGLAGRARDPERVRRLCGRDALVLAPGAGVVAFTERGLAAWMERRTDAVATEFKRWFEAEVVAPYRRKRGVENQAL